MCSNKLPLGPSSKTLGNDIGKFSLKTTLVDDLSNVMCTNEKAVKAFFVSSL